MINRILIEVGEEAKFTFEIEFSNGKVYSGECKNGSISFGPVFLHPDKGYQRHFELQGVLLDDVAVGMMEFESSI